MKRPVQVQFKYGTVMVLDFYSKKLEKHRISIRNAVFLVEISGIEPLTS